MFFIKIPLQCKYPLRVGDNLAYLYLPYLGGLILLAAEPIYEVFDTQTGLTEPFIAAPSIVSVEEQGTMDEAELDDAFEYDTSSLAAASNAPV